jgi:hypothetical protein
MIRIGNTKFIDVFWSGGAGIVLVQDTVTNEYKAYMKYVEGLIESEDIKDIMNWGNTFPIEAAEKLFQRDLK